MLPKHKGRAEGQPDRTCLSDETMAYEENSLHDVSSIRLYIVLVLCQACSYNYTLDEVTSTRN